MTNNTKTIFVYGDSMLMIGVEVTLRANPARRVIHINPAHPAALGEWAAINDGVLIYDRGVTAPHKVSAFLATHRKVVAVSLDADENVVRVHTHHHHQEYHTQGMADLIQLIETLA
jgi:hypothetical protein